MTVPLCGAVPVPKPGPESCQTAIPTVPWWWEQTEGPASGSPCPAGPVKACLNGGALLLDTAGYQFGIFPHKGFHSMHMPVKPSAAVFLHKAGKFRMKVPEITAKLPRLPGRGFLYKENHSLGEWFKRRLLPIMRTRKTPFARIEVRSGNCTKKQREVTQNERQ